jgi:hypothetical protein
MNDSTIPKVIGTPSYAGSSKRVLTSILSVLGALVTILTLLAHFNPVLTYVAGVITAIILALNQIFGMQATGPVTTQKPE